MILLRKFIFTDMKDYTQLGFRIYSTSKYQSLLYRNKKIWIDSRGFYTYALNNPHINFEYGFYHWRKIRINLGKKRNLYCSSFEPDGLYYYNNIKFIISLDTDNCSFKN